MNYIFSLLVMSLFMISCSDITPPKIGTKPIINLSGINNTFFTFEDESQNIYLHIKNVELVTDENTGQVNNLVSVEVYQQGPFDPEKINSKESLFTCKSKKCLTEEVNSNYEKFPLPVWQKVKRGDEFIIQYINPEYVTKFGHLFKIIVGSLTIFAFHSDG